MAASRRRRTAVIAVLAVVGLLGTVAGYAAWTKWRVDSGLAAINRVEAFPGREAGPAPSTGAMTFLIAGLDTRQSTTGTKASAATDYGHERSDAIMLVRLNDSRDKAVLLSIPRDTLASIPEFQDPVTGQLRPGQTRKVNAAYSLGGAPLLIRTVEGLTGITVDHYAEIDFEGIIEFVDQLGGICVDNPETTTTPYGDQTKPGAPPWHFEKGRICLDGMQTRVWVGQKPEALGYDSYRVQLQQELVQEVLARVGGASLANPVNLNQILDLAARVASVDNTLSDGALKTLALSARGLDPAGLTTVTAAGTPRVTLRTDAGASETVFLWDSASNNCLTRAFLAVDGPQMQTCVAD